MEIGYCRISILVSVVKESYIIGEMGGLARVIFSFKRWQKSGILKLKIER